MAVALGHSDPNWDGTEPLMPLNSAAISDTQRNLSYPLRDVEDADA